MVRMIVKCVNDIGGNLTYGEEYDVEHRTPTYIFVKDDEGDVMGFKAERFVMIQDGLTVAQEPNCDTCNDTRCVYNGPIGDPPSECEACFDQEPDEPQRNKYSREVKPGVYIDVYDVLRAFAVTDPSLQHLIKKALAVGNRGHKDAAEDLQDILDSAKRAVEMHKEWNDN